MGYIYVPDTREVTWLPLPPSAHTTAHKEEGDLARCCLEGRPEQTWDREPEHA